MYDNIDFLDHDLSEKKPPLSKKNLTMKVKNFEIVSSNGQALLPLEEIKQEEIIPDSLKISHRNT